MPLELYLQVIPFLVLLTLGFTVGGFVERRHLRRLGEAEADLRDVVVTDLRVVPPSALTASVGLVTGEVVIASDYFKTVAAKVRGLFGGELRTFQSLMDRARREALVRLIRRAKALGANRVYNVRFESSNIGAVRRNKAAAMVELCAYGTAIFVPDDDASE